MGHNQACLVFLHSSLLICAADNSADLICWEPFLSYLPTQLWEAVGVNILFAIKLQYLYFRRTIDKCSISATAIPPLRLP
jgi:hypothetical protein